jgi:hypothetical protein
MTEPREVGTKRKPTQEEVFLVAARVLNERGYLVVAWPPDSIHPSIGGITHELGGFASPSPLRLIHQTDCDDWIEQFHVWISETPDGFPKPYIPQASPGDFFRVITD